MVDFNLIVICKFVSVSVFNLQNSFVFTNSITRLYVFKKRLVE